jgi:hypothetical protein
MENEELWKKIETQVDGILDTLSQDRNSIVDKIDEDLKDFILTLCIDIALPREKQITKAKNYLRFLLGVVHIKNTYNDVIEEQITEIAKFLKEEEQD